MKFISLLTDFGMDQEYVGVCKAVMLSICPTAVIVDISHNVLSYGIEEGAFMLKSFVRYAPVGVHVAVIDPGVGTERRGVAVKTERGDVLVGPDNGVLMEAADFLQVVSVHALENPQYMLETVSSSFHGRDVFAPAAAHLAEGVAVTNLGRALLYEELKRIDKVTVGEDEKMISGSVLRIDRFGNIQLSIPSDRIKRTREVSIRIGEKDVVLPFVKTFGEVNPGELLIYEDSDGLLTVSQNQGDASKILSATRRMKVLIFKK
ncbi:MAG: SAM-dependent chlorinase/fluorinase [Theionarchaea archaeon]|nr:SAM-dependent chlorinase/fluorinase [Theionarchaea archaeon]